MSDKSAARPKVVAVAAKRLKKFVIFCMLSTRPVYQKTAACKVCLHSRSCFKSRQLPANRPLMRTQRRPRITLLLQWDRTPHGVQLALRRAADTEIVANFIAAWLPLARKPSESAFHDVQEIAGHHFELAIALLRVANRHWVRVLRKFPKARQLRKALLPRHPNQSTCNADYRKVAPDFRSDIPRIGHIADSVLTAPS